MHVQRQSNAAQGLLCGLFGRLSAHSSCKPSKVQRVPVLRVSSTLEALIWGQRKGTRVSGHLNRAPSSIKLIVGHAYLDLLSTHNIGVRCPQTKGLKAVMRA